MRVKDMRSGEPLLLMNNCSVQPRWVFAYSLRGDCGASRIELLRKMRGHNLGTHGTDSATWGLICGPLLFRVSLIGVEGCHKGDGFKARDKWRCVTGARRDSMARKTASLWGSAMNGHTARVVSESRKGSCEADYTFLYHDMYNPCMVHDSRSSNVRF